MLISVVTPVHNERDNLQPLIEEIERSLSPLGRDFEIIAVDDGSRDGSQEKLRELARTHPKLKAVFFRQNFGQAAAFDAGFRYAKGDIIVTIDSDLQNDPADIPRLITLIEQGNDFVTGHRKNRKDGFFSRTVPSLIANSIIRFVTKTRVRDLGCSLKAFRREITDELRLYGEMHRFLAVLVEGLGAKVAELEVNHRPRVHGQSKYGLMRTFKVLLDLVTVWFIRGYQTKPIYIFGGAGLGLILLSIASASLVLYEKYAQGVWVHRNPLFIISMLFGVVGAQFVGMGIIAEIIVRTYFEAQYKSTYSVAGTLGFSAQKSVEL